MGLPTLNEMIESDMNDLYDTNEGAIDVQYQLYKDEYEEWTSIKAFLSYNSDLELQQFGSARGATFTVRSKDVKRPRVYDKIKYNGEIYVVLQIVAGNRHHWILATSSDPRVIPAGL